MEQLDNWCIEEQQCYTSLSDPLVFEIKINGLSAPLFYSTNLRRLGDLKMTFSIHLDGLRFRI
jgi:hypothetical protein